LSTIEKWATALNTIKSFAKYLIIPAGAITFLPDQWLSYIRLLEIKNIHGSWIAVLFFFCLSIIVIDFISIKITETKEKKMAKRQIEGYIQSLLSLTNSEKSIINEIYLNDIGNYSLKDALVNKLERLNIVMRPNVGSGYELNMSYTLQPWVLDYLRRNPNYFN
jgi:hypothetical protein